MSMTKRLPLLLASCLFAGGLAWPALAQPWMDRDWDQGRDQPDRGWDRDQDRDRGRRWRDRNRFGDIVVRRYRVCED